MMRCVCGARNGHLGLLRLLLFSGLVDEICKRCYGIPAQGNGFNAQPHEKGKRLMQGSQDVGELGSMHAKARQLDKLELGLKLLERKAELRNNSGGEADVREPELFQRAQTQELHGSQWNGTRCAGACTAASAVGRKGGGHNEPVRALGEEVVPCLVRHGALGTCSCWVLGNEGKVHSGPAHGIKPSAGHGEAGQGHEVEACCNVFQHVIVKVNQAWLARSQLAKRLQINGSRADIKTVKGYRPILIVNVARSLQRAHCHFSVCVCV